MNILKHIALVSAVALAPAFALAQAPAAGAPAATPPAATKAEAGKGGEHHQKRAERLKAADKDGDGAISKAEADAAGMKGLSKNFDKVDANKDGKVSREEMRTARAEHKGAHKGEHKGEHKGMHGGDKGATPAAPATPPATK
jgi:hypothetical protein